MKWRTCELEENPQIETFHLNVKLWSIAEDNFTAIAQQIFEKSNLPADFSQERISQRQNNPLTFHRDQTFTSDVFPRLFLRFFTRGRLWISSLANNISSGRKHGSVRELGARRGSFSLSPATLVCTAPQSNGLHISRSREELWLTCRL